MWVPRCSTSSPRTTVDVTSSGRAYRGKRTLDVVVAASIAALTIPISLVAGAAVRASSPGPILHRARRMGQGGEPFTLYKFRSMVADAAATGSGITIADDDRITAVGRRLRRWKLDELPQLWNVLRGDMSIVGPRPEDPRYVETYPPHLRAVLSWRPGLTSPASIEFRHEEQILAGAADPTAAYGEVLRQKLELDLAYLERQSLTGDIRIIFRTLLAVIR